MLDFMNASVSTKAKMINTYMDSVSVICKRPGTTRYPHYLTFNLWVPGFIIPLKEDYALSLHVSSHMMCRFATHLLAVKCGGLLEAEEKEQLMLGCSGVTNPSVNLSASSCRF